MKVDLNDNWLLLDGNGEEQNYHVIALPIQKAVTAQLPCFTHMYIEDHVGISWFEKFFTLPALPTAQEKALLCFEQTDFRAEVSLSVCCETA